MLTLTVSPSEEFDEYREEFIEHEGFTLELEHSLVSLSKWESVWEKPFLSNDEKTTDEILSYIECMNTSSDIPKDFLSRLSNPDIQKINAYINANMTATWFTEKKGPGRKSNEVITSEIVYYWMIALNIPFECQRWHLNRLLTLIKVTNQKNNPDKKKMSKREIMDQNRSLNEQRKAEMKSRG